MTGLSTALSPRFWFWMIAPVAWWAWVIAYAAEEWSSGGHFQYAYLSAALAVALAWRDRIWLPLAGDAPWAFSGFILILASMPLMALGELFRSQAGAYSPPAAWALVAAAVLLTVGSWIRRQGPRSTRRIWPVLLLLILAMPLPAAIWSQISSGLELTITQAATATLSALGIEATLQGGNLVTANATLAVDDACNGLRSLQASIAASVFIGCLVLKRPLHRTLLLLLSFFTVLAASAGRVVWLLWASQHTGLEITGAPPDAAAYRLFGVCAVAAALLAALFVRRDRKWEGPSPASVAALPGIGKDDFYLQGLLVLLLFALHVQLAERAAWDEGDAALGKNPRDVAGYTVIRVTAATPLQEQLRFDEASDARLVSGDGATIGIFNARWSPGEVSARFVGRRLPAAYHESAGWQALDEPHVAPLMLCGSEWPVVWQNIRTDGRDLLVGYLHLVGGQARTFTPDGRGLFSWRAFAWDITHGKLAPQEVLIVSVPREGREQEARQMLGDLLAKRFPRS